MSLPSAAAYAKDAALATFASRRLQVIARSGRSRRPLCLVYGNCQAEPIRALLARSGPFTQQYQTVAIPAVHEVGARGVRTLQRLARMAALIVAQPIKAGYRGLPVGTQEMAALAPAGCRVVRFPALYYDALYPFQVIVHVGSPRVERKAISAPVTIYHDLRNLCAAAKGLRGENALRWIGEFRPPAGAIGIAATQATELIRRHDRCSDISAFDVVVGRDSSPQPSFFTVNHSAHSVLRHIAEALHSLLGLTPPVDAGRDDTEPLGTFRTPREQPVIEALGLGCEPQPDWVIRGRRVRASEVARRQLAWYSERPDLVRAALHEHADRIALLGLDA